MHMQTAFNPGLPGAGEGVRIFTKTLKHMSGGALAIKIVEPGRIAPTKDMLDAVIAGDLEAAFTWSGYAAAKAPVFSLFAHRAVRPGPERDDLVAARGRRRPHPSRRLRQARRRRHPCGMQGAKGGGWFRADLNTAGRLQGRKPALRPDRRARSIAKMGATLVPLPPGEFFYKLQQGQVDGGEMSTPAIDAALGFDKLGLPYYMPGWQQPSAVIDFLMRKDKWEALPADAARADRDGLPRQHRLDAEPLAATAGAGAGEARASGVVIKQWSPEIMQGVPQQGRNRAQGTAPSAIRILPPRWPTSAPSSARASTGGRCRACRRARVTLTR